MRGPSRKRHKQSRYRHIEPLTSTRREDGLWQSIERDEEELASHLEGHAIASLSGTYLAAKEDGVSNKDMTHQTHPRHRDIATTRGKAETSDAPSASDTKPVKTDSPPASTRRPTPTRGDLPERALNCPLPHPGLPAPVQPVQDTLQGDPSSPNHPQPTNGRRRGRPRKSRNAPNWSRARRVRFSDPIPPDPDLQPETRDTHVFVRLLKIIVSAEDPNPPQRQELVWNNRAKGWRLAGERSERNIGDIGELFDDLPRHGSLLRVMLAPTVQRGAREPVEVGWNAASCCFQGVSQDVGTLSVTLGEMKDMVKDPWARQFVGYVLM